MKQRITIIGILLIAILSQVACFEKDTLAVLKAATALNNAVVDARTAGKIPDAQWNQIQPKLKTFHDAVDKGYVLLSIYHQSQSPETKAALEALLKLLRPSGDQSQPSLFDELSKIAGVK